MQSSLVLKTALKTQAHEATPWLLQLAGHDNFLKDTGT